MIGELFTKYNQTAVGHVLQVALTVPPLIPVGLLSRTAAAIDFGSTVVELQEIAVGLGGATHVSPTDLVPIPDGSGRMGVSTINGVVRLIDSNGSLLDSEATPYLDTRSEPNRYIPGNFAFGMTGIAFHPDFAQEGFAGYGKFYTILTERHHSAGTIQNPNQPDLFDGLPEAGGAHQDVLVEWSASDPSIDNPTWTRRTVLRMEQPHENHNVTDVAFGPDGLLYLASGDGGNPSRFTAPQDVTTYIGKMLRVDPLSSSAEGTRSTSGDFITSSNGEYRIPMTNPGVGIPIEVDEAYAYGFRSPYRFNFDDATGDLYLGDVGENSREEVSVITLDGNYGWGRFEGTLERDPSIILVDGTTHAPPLFEYGRRDGETVVGGFVYRGSAIPELSGKYVFAEFGRQVSAGQVATPARLFAGDPATGDIKELRIALTGEQLSETDADGELISRQFILSIGQDLAGEFYLVVGDDPQFPRAIEPDGRILKIQPVSLPGVAGDVNFDGLVNDDDVEQFLLGWRKSGFISVAEALSNGDLNLDGTTNWADWHILKSNYSGGNDQLNLADLLASEDASIPEPNAALLCAIAAPLWPFGRIRHSVCRHVAANHQRVESCGATAIIRGLLQISNFRGV